MGPTSQTRVQAMRAANRRAIRQAQADERVARRARPAPNPKPVEPLPPVGTPRTLARRAIPRGRFYFGASTHGGRYYVDAHSRRAAERKRDAAIARGDWNVGQVLERRG